MEKQFQLFNMRITLLQITQKRHRYTEHFFASCWYTAEQPLTEESYHFADLPTHEATPEEVFALMNKLDVNKANVPYGILAFMLKATAN